MEITFGTPIKFSSQGWMSFRCYHTNLNEPGDYWWIDDATSGFISILSVPCKYLIGRFFEGWLKFSVGV